MGWGGVSRMKSFNLSAGIMKIVLFEKIVKKKVCLLVYEGQKEYLCACVYIYYWLNYSKK